MSEQPEFSKEYLCAQLRRDYGWRIDRQMNFSQTMLIFQAAHRIDQFIETYLPGVNSTEWIKKHTRGLKIHLAGFPQRTISLLCRQETSIVFPYRDIWLIKDFETKNGLYHLVHEIGHVVDNFSSKYKLATFWGSGYADRLNKKCGGTPVGLRFSNQASRLPKRHQFSATYQAGYGNTASAEYFAEVFATSVFQKDQLPNPEVFKYLIDVLSDFKGDRF
ncbi:MAG: hypothetical protein ABFD29_09245 [Anaerolineaceae bacterium]